MLPSVVEDDEAAAVASQSASFCFVYASDVRRVGNRGECLEVYCLKALAGRGISLGPHAMVLTWEVDSDQVLLMEVGAADVIENAAGVPLGWIGLLRAACSDAM